MAETGLFASDQRAIDENLLLVGDLIVYDRGPLCKRLSQAIDCDDRSLILQAYRVWGDECFAQINGDFAVALWDGRRQALILARDIAGLRPLHYIPRHDGVDFASMGGGLAQLDGSAAPDHDRWLRYVVLLPQQGRHSFFAGVQRVEPGETVVIQPAGIRHLRSWSPPSEDPHIKFNDAVEEMRATLDAAVADRMAASVGPFSAQLSAGMDSSAVFASAARQTAETIYAFTGAPLPGSVGPLPKTRFADESVIAARTAAIYPNAVHKRVQSALEPTLVYADRWAALIEQPLRSYGNLGWTEATLAGAARRGSRHILTGNFGNVSFSEDGFSAIPEALAQGQLATWIQLTAGVRRQPGVRWRGAFARSLPAILNTKQIQVLARLAGGEGEIDGFADTYLKLRHPLVEGLREWALAHEDWIFAPVRSGRAARLPLMSWIDNGCYHHGAQSAFGVEQLDPTADRRVIDLSFTLPTRLFIEGGRPRSLAIEVLRGSVDPAVLSINKGVQGQDWHISFAQSVADMRSEVRRLRDHYDLAAIIRLDDLDAGLVTWDADPATARNDFRGFELISRTLCAARWARRIIDGEVYDGCS